MAASWARLACMVRRNGQQHAAVPRHLIRQLPSELAPALVENGTVQARFLRHFFAVLFTIAFGRPGHVPYLQILNTNERVVLADRCCSLVQEIFPGVSDAGVNLLDAGFCLFPVTTELCLTTHAPLVTGKAFLMFLEAVERRDVTFVAHGSEPGNADIDTYGRRRGGQRLFDFALRLFDFALRLDRREPLAARLADCDVADLA